MFSFQISAGELDTGVYDALCFSWRRALFTHVELVLVYVHRKFSPSPPGHPLCALVRQSRRLCNSENTAELSQDSPSLTLSHSSLLVEKQHLYLPICLRVASRALHVLGALFSFFDFLFSVCVAFDCP